MSKHAQPPRDRSIEGVGLLQDGMAPAEVARRLGVTRQAVHQWVARWEAEHGQALTAKRLSPEARGLVLPDEPEARALELARMRKQNARNRQRDEGLTRFEIWVHPKDRATVRTYVARLNDKRRVK